MPEKRQLTFELRDLVREPDPALFDEVYRRILRPAFDDDELESAEEISRQIAEGTRLRLLAAFDPAGEPLGAVTSDWYPGADVLLIGYLAVSPATRGTGIGSELMRRALAAWTAELGPALVLAEVEDPRFFEVTEHGDPYARVRFYERLGGRIVALPYFQPSLAEDTQRVQHLVLMSLNQTPDGADHVPTEPVAQFLDEYFATCEGPQVAEEPDFRALRALVLREPTAALLTGDDLDRLPIFESVN